MDIENMQLEDITIEGLEQAYDEWKPEVPFPPAIKPGKHTALLTEIHEDSISVKNGVLNLKVDFEMKGGDEDGQKLTFYSLTSRMQRRFRDNVLTSPILDIIKASGIDNKPTTTKELLSALNYIKDAARFLSFRSDLEAQCFKCKDEALFKQTGVEMPEAPTKEELNALRQTAYEALRNMAPEQRKAANAAIRKAQYVATTAKGIPMGPNKRHVDTMVCPLCRTEVRVQPIIRAWLVTTNGSVPADATPF